MKKSNKRPEINPAAVREYLRKGMYTKNAKGEWRYVKVHSAIPAVENKRIMEIVRPIAEAVIRTDFSKSAGINSSASNAKVCKALAEVATYLGIFTDKAGEKLKFLGCDANAWRHQVSALDKETLDAGTASSIAIVKYTMIVIGKRYRRTYYISGKDGEEWC